MDVTGVIRTTRNVDSQIETHAVEEGQQNPDLHDWTWRRRVSAFPESTGSPFESKSPLYGMKRWVTDDRSTGLGRCHCPDACKGTVWRDPVDGRYLSSLDAVHAHSFSQCPFDRQQHQRSHQTPPPFSLYCTCEGVSQEKAPTPTSRILLSVLLSWIVSLWRR